MEQKYRRAEAELAGFRAEHAELVNDRDRLAERIAVGDAKPAEWSSVYNRCLELGAMIGAVSQHVETLREGAHREAEADRVSSMMRSNQAEAEIQAKISAHPQNASRIFNQCLAATHQCETKMAHTKGRGRVTIFNDDIAQFVIPMGMVQRSFVPNAPDWIVVDEAALRKWIIQNAFALISVDEIQARIVAKKRERDNQPPAQPHQQIVTNHQRGF